MIIEKAGYVFTAVADIENNVMVLIQDKTTGKIVDVADVRISFLNDIERKIDFSVASLYERCESIFKETGVLPEIFAEISKLAESHETVSENRK